MITYPTVSLRTTKTAAEKMTTLLKDFQKGPRQTAWGGGRGGGGGEGGGGEEGGGGGCRVGLYGIGESRLRCPRGRDQTRAQHHRDPELK